MAIDEDRRLAAGGETDTNVHWGRDRGLFVGLHTGRSWATGQVGDESRDGYRTGARLGYAWLPLPHLSWVGLEASASLTQGQVFTDGENHPAWLPALGVGVPMRVRRGVPIWQAERAIWPTLLVIPAFTSTLALPAGPGGPREPRVLLGAGLSGRIHFWSSLMP